MEIFCPHCGDHIEWNWDVSGTEKICPHCGGEFQMPKSIRAAAPEHTEQPAGTEDERFGWLGGADLEPWYSPRRQRRAKAKPVGLFDFEFRRFGARQLVPNVYFLLVVLTFVYDIYYFLFSIYIAVTVPSFAVFQILILGFVLVASLVHILVVRILLECVLKLFQAENHLSVIKRQKRAEQETV